MKDLSSRLKQKAKKEAGKPDLVIGGNSSLSVKQRVSKSSLISVAVIFGALGVAMVIRSFAATPSASIEPENSTLTAPATKASDATASGGQYVQFGAVPTPPTGSCVGAANTPGGADPWGGCFPGLDNTGPNNPSVTTPATLTNYTGPCTITTPDIVIENKIINCDAVLIKDNGGGLIIKNSRIVDGFIDNTAPQPSSGRLVTIQDSEIHGGTWIGGTVWGSYLTVIRSEVTGGQHNIHCERNCTVIDSYLHSQYAFIRNGDESHNNGYLSNGGSNQTLRHNSVYCNANCSADINLNSDGNQTNDLVERNLLVAAPKAASCLYAVVTPGDGTIFQFIKIIENIFQRGANGKCGGLDPVNGPFTVSNTPGTNGYGNEWRDNKWDDGTVLNP